MSVNNYHGYIVAAMGQNCYVHSELTTFIQRNLSLAQTVEVCAMVYYNHDYYTTRN